MQLISSYNYSNNNGQNSKNKKILNLVIIGIIIVILISVCLIGAIYYLNLKQQKALKVFVDNKKINIKEDSFIISNNGKIYIAIKDIANSLGYDIHNGEYKINSEEDTKCYVENKYETASFFLNSNKVSKVPPNSQEEYVNFTISEPVIKENNKLYVISDGIKVGCNVAFNYDKNTNTINIYTLQYLSNNYNKNPITGYGYKGISTEFNNQKAILYNMFVVQNTNEKFGVIDLNNNEIIGCKYDNIEFNENTQEFFVTNTLKKVGIILSNGVNKINIEYDEISVLNKEKELYLVKNNNKYGVIDKNGSTKINVVYDDIKILDIDLGLYIIKYNNKYGIVDENDKQVIYWEYDSIGIDTKTFASDKIENANLLFENAIPVKLGNKWGLFDIKGKSILECEYDGFGCIATGTKGKVENNVLIVPECECIVVKKDNKYGIIDKNGNLLVQYLLDNVYSVTNAGKNTYYMNFEHNGEQIEYEIPWYLEQMGLYKPKKENQTENKEESKNENTNNETNTLEQNNQVVENTIKQEENNEFENENNIKL